MVFIEEENETRDIDVSDICDDDDEEEQNKKPRAKDYPSGSLVDLEEKDKERKRKADEDLLESMECDNGNVLKKKHRDDNSGKGKFAMIYCL